jgi:hypothetical protein
VENKNQACYTEELTYCVQLITALEFVIQVLEDNPCRYPSLMSDVLTLLNGRAVKVNGNIYMVNGLEQQVQELYDTMESLELEVQFEMGDEDGETL